MSLPLSLMPHMCAGNSAIADAITSGFWSMLAEVAAGAGVGSGGGAAG